LNKRHALYNIAGPVLQVAIAFVSVPVYLKLLGIDRYGMVVAMLLLTTYLGLFDAGASKAVAFRFAAAETPERRFSAFTSTLAIALLISSFAAGLAFLAMRAVFMPLLFATSNAVLNAEVLGAATVALLTVPFSTTSTVVTGALDGQARFAVSNLLSIAAATGQLVGPILCVLAFGPSVTVAFGGILASRIVIALAGVAIVLSGGATRRSAPFDVGEAKIALRFGGWMTVTNLVSPILNSIDQLILTATAGVAALPHYSIPLGAIARASIIPGGIARTLFPHLASSSLDQANAAANDTAQAISAIMTPLCLIGFVWLDIALWIWLGASLEPTMTVIGRIGLLGIWALSFSQVPAVLAQARGRAHLIAFVHVGEVVPYMAAMYLAASTFGPIGAAAAWTARCCVDAVLHVAVVGIRVPLLSDVVPFLLGAATIATALVLGADLSSLATKAALTIACAIVCAPALLRLIGASGGRRRLAAFGARWRDRPAG
jgi:O-antigen/teichoic acid export membrane protein